MEDNKRFVNTPRVEVGSPEYYADAAFLKLFREYRDYLEYLSIWNGKNAVPRLFGDCTTGYLDYLSVWHSEWLSGYFSQCQTDTNPPVDYVCEVTLVSQSDNPEEFSEILAILCNDETPCGSDFPADVALAGTFMTQEEYDDYIGFGSSTSSPEVCDDFPFDRGYLKKDRSRASRREATKKAHEHKLRLFETFEKNKPTDGNTCIYDGKNNTYKRARILQPHCTELAYVYRDADDKVVAINPFDTSYICVSDDVDVVNADDIIEDEDSGLLGLLYCNCTLEVIGCRLSDKTLRATQCCEHFPEISANHATALYELELIMSAMPGISKKTAKKILRLIYEYLESREEKKPGKSLLKHLRSLVHPELQKKEEKKEEKKKDEEAVLPLREYTAYMEVCRLIEAVMTLDSEGSEDASEVPESATNCEDERQIHANAHNFVRHSHKSQNIVPATIPTSKEIPRTCEPWIYLGSFPAVIPYKYRPSICYF